MAALVESSFDVAFWFVDRAMEEGEYLQPQKLQRLMYLAQAYFAAAYDGRMMMPAVFVADPTGPVEPGVYRLFATAIPALERKPLPKEANQFLDLVWRRFGQHSAQYLGTLLAPHAPYRDALERGPGSIIPLKAMVAFYGKKTESMPAPSSLVPPRLLRSQSGQAVTVKKWAPAALKKGD